MSGTRLAPPRAQQSTTRRMKRSHRTHVSCSCLHDRQLLCGVGRWRSLSVGPFVVAAADGQVGWSRAMRVLETLIVVLVVTVAFMWVILAHTTPEEQARLHDSMGESTHIAWR